MSSQNRRSSVTTSTSSSLAKRHAENLGKAQPYVAKKRPALANVTNQRHGSQNGPRSLVSGSSNMVSIYF